VMLYMNMISGIILGKQDNDRCVLRLDRSQHL